MNNEFVSVPREPSDETLRAMLEVIRPATYRKHLRYPGAGEKTSQAEEVDISVAKRQYAAVINSAQSAAQHQGEPVMKLEAEKLWGGDGEYAVSFAKAGWLQECREKGGTFLLYTHADTGEVERLSAKVGDLRKSLTRARKAHASSQGILQGHIETLRAQLTERDALLLSIYNTEPLAAETSRRIETALSASAEPTCKCPVGTKAADFHVKECPASAEPSALVCETCSDNGAVGNILNAEPCPDCSYTAPVALDERAEYEAACHARAKSNGRTFEPHYFKRASADGRYLNPMAESGWQGWKARAALELKLVEAHNAGSSQRGVVNVEGYHFAGDGGGGKWFLDLGQENEAVSLLNEALQSGGDWVFYVRPLIVKARDLLERKS